MPHEFKVRQIDHVELLVPDRSAAADWYRQIFGLKPVAEHKDWATPEGPLMISSDGGNTMLALFEGEPESSQQAAGFHRVAFRVDGSGFMRFLDRLEEHPVFDDRGEQVTARNIRDHDKAYSIYFCDPWGHRYELTTYDYGEISARYRQELWIGFSSHAATFSSSPSTNSPFLNSAPALTSATRFERRLASATSPRLLP